LIPPLVMEVTLQTLRSLGVDLMVCDGEADGLVAQLAMEKSLDEDVDEAYAVSKDSGKADVADRGGTYNPKSAPSLTISFFLLICSPS